jgi:1-acyl-sn-glycerol-3-phosphate acyltransferase
MIRTLATAGVGIPLTVVFAGWIALSSALRLPGTGFCCRALPRLWARAILWSAGARVRVEGLERLDGEKPMILAANHQSWFDVFALLATLPPNIRFVAKQELGRIPIFGPAWKACGHVSVDRTDRAQAVASIEGATRRIWEERLAVLFFPEGTRSPDGRLGAFKKGAFVLAIQTGVPVVPVAISGSRDAMPKGSFRIRSASIRVRLGDPIPTDGKGLEDRDRLLADCRARILALGELMDGEEGEPGPSEAPGRHG